MRRTADGSFELILPDWQRDLMEALTSQLRDLLVAEADDELLRRLYPTAHAQDADADREYRALTHDQLLEGRLVALDAVERTLRDESLTEADAMAWMRVANDLRLVIGTRLDISEETDLSQIAEGHPDEGLFLGYDVLTALVAELVDAAAGW
ncbi:MAG: DUF2017 family protein [Acidimicrobiales bacterium]|nr:DUF2017 family protein [Acidimicrobiales bacterium]